MVGETKSFPGLPDLYRQTVLDHSRHPRNFRRLDPADRLAQGHNTLCGDKVTVYLNLEGDRLADVTFEGTGCAISLASASLMTEILRGQATAAARDATRVFLDSFRDPAGPPLPGDLAALAGVRDYPSRIRCATLPWQTLMAALENRHETVSTEPSGTEHHG